MNIGIALLLLGLIANVPRFALVFMIAEGVQPHHTLLSAAAWVSGAGNGMLITGGVGYVVHQWIDARKRQLLGWKSRLLLAISIALLAMSAVILSPWIASAVTGSTLASVLTNPASAGRLVWLWSVVLVLSVDLAVGGVMTAQSFRRTSGGDGRSGMLAVITGYLTDYRKQAGGKPEETRAITEQDGKKSADAVIAGNDKRSFPEFKRAVKDGRLSPSGMTGGDVGDWANVSASTGRRWKRRLDNPQ